jgi:hypothetical protein
MMHKEIPLTAVIASILILASCSAGNGQASAPSVAPTAVPATPAPTDTPAGFNSQADGQAVLGKNETGTFGYTSPNPPDKDHTYVITLYALDAKTGLKKDLRRTSFSPRSTGTSSRRPR